MEALAQNKRSLSLLLFVTVTACTLSTYAKLLSGLLTINYDWKFELCAVLGQILFQLPFVFKTGKAQAYIFNLLQVSFIGSLLLWPLLMANHFFALDDLINIIYFFGVVLFMFVEHKKRVHTLQLPWFLSYTWVLYRSLILIFILYGTE